MKIALYKYTGLKGLSFDAVFEYKPEAKHEDFILVSEPLEVEFVMRTDHLQMHKEKLEAELEKCAKEQDLKIRKLESELAHLFDVSRGQI